MDAAVILSIPLCTRNITDFWSWRKEKKGSFTVRSAYKMLVQTKFNRGGWLEESAGSSSNVSKDWASLWDTQVPSKIEFFSGDWRSTRYPQMMSWPHVTWLIIQDADYVEARTHGNTCSSNVRCPAVYGRWPMMTWLSTWYEQTKVMLETGYFLSWPHYHMLSLIT